MASSFESNTKLLLAQNQSVHPWFGKFLISYHSVLPLHKRFFLYIALQTFFVEILSTIFFLKMISKQYAGVPQQTINDSKFSILLNSLVYSNLPLLIHTSLERLEGLDLSMLKIWGLQIKGLQSYQLSKLEAPLEPVGPDLSSPRVKPFSQFDGQ